MTAKNRAGLIAKLHTSLKKHYKPAPAAPGRPLLEHILYAALLEDAPVDLADEGFAKCEQEFFDWNEVRVTSVTELAEVLTRFPSPQTTSARLKRCLQSVFETFYNFDIDHLKKENLGKAVAKFEAMSGVSPFVLAYLVQHGLGGHAIPVNAAAMHIMLKAAIVSDSEAQTGKVPGLERAIPKSKAIEFSSMLHQAAVNLQADPLDKTVWEVILSVNKDAVASAPKPEPKRKMVKRPIAKTDPAKPPSQPTKPPTAKTSGKPKPAASGKESGDAKSSAKVTGKASAAAKASGGTKAAATAPAAKPASESAKPTPVKPSSTAAGAAQPEQVPVKRAPSGKAGSKKASSSIPAAKKGAPKTSKKSDSTASAKPAAGKKSSKAAPSSKSTNKPTKKNDTKKTTAAPVAVGSGNQKLTKRKPR